MYRDKETALLAEIQRLNLEKQQLEKSLVSALAPKDKTLVKELKAEMARINVVIGVLLIPAICVGFVLSVYLGFYVNAALQLLVVLCTGYNILKNNSSWRNFHD